MTLSRQEQFFRKMKKGEKEKFATGELRENSGWSLNGDR
jgi:hypothetical protein